ncbi:glycosyltransferase [Halalkalibaculum sp. DA3122]|uniref:glycosyltransferase n=1 Tax=unclassified Halalkalibaculum TaxID=2964617 RepID=UPI00375523F6
MKAKSAPEFSVIIPVYNNWETLKLCLSALQKQSLDQELYEIVVVNNASTVPLPDGLNLPRNARIIEEPNPGSYAARNTGASVANGSILAFTDSDCIPDTQWLSNAKKMFEDTNCDLIGGEIEVFLAEDGAKHAYIYDKHFAFRQKEWVPNGKSCTANLIIKKSIFYKAGKFDSTLKSGGDWEFSKRCVGKGYDMQYGESVIIRHPARKTLRALLKKHYRHICWGSIITREKYQCGQLKVLLSSLKGAFQRLFRKNPQISKKYERFVVLYIDFIKLVVQLYGNLLLLFKLKDPHKVRE